MWQVALLTRLVPASFKRFLQEKELGASSFNGFLQYVKKYHSSRHLFKVNNGNSRKICEICSRLAIKIPERWHQSGARMWRRCVVVVTTAQLHLAKSSLRFSAGSNPHDVSKICKSGKLWEQVRLELRCNVFLRSTMP